ncbi:MAG: NAD(P)-dependent oxidoreductase [Lachnospiraceae bacterium]|nr:NAD(P)-dependent oxidoreductase [Lachnospiraceae bacterium]MDY5701527.1 NAD(P)-dependent oxidoreductase [Lachnospiraceae bacterium]
MKVVILGGSGYLGQKLGKYLAGQGMEVYSAVRHEMPQAAGNMWAKAVWKNEELKRKLQEYSIDWMINCIACYERAGKTPEEVLLGNYVKPYQYFSEGIERGIRRYMTMDTGLAIDCNLYSRSKKQFADSVEWKLNEVYGKEDYVFWNIRLENFYGGDEPKERFIPGTIDKLFGNEKVLLTEGIQKRDFIHIDDVVRNLAKLLSIEEKGRVDLPLGTGKGAEVREVVSYLKEITGSDAELCFGAVPARKVEPDCIADITKMQYYNLDIFYDWKSGLKRMVSERSKLRG